MNIYSRTYKKKQEKKKFLLNKFKLAMTKSTHYLTIALTISCIVKKNCVDSMEMSKIGISLLSLHVKIKNYKSIAFTFLGISIIMCL